jgi:hypothetical protein
MKTIKDLPLQKRIHEVLDYNLETGEFRWKYRPELDGRENGRWAGKIAGSKGKKSIKIMIDGVQYSAHRIAWVYIYGDVLTQEIQIDHKNNNPFINRINNLREATHAQNCSNARKWKKKDLPKGVSVQTKSGRYRARLQVGKNVIHIGTYDTPELAHAAYCDAAKKYKGEFARAA